MKESSHERFTRYFNKYNDELFQYVAYDLKTNREEAVDLLEDVWVTFWEKFYQTAGLKDMQVRKWLRKTAYYKVRNYRRKKRHCCEIPFPFEELERLCVQNTIREEMEEALLEECIRLLKPVERAVINIRREGKSYQDISVIMNRSTQSLECIHSRAVKKLRLMMGRKLTSFW